MSWKGFGFVGHLPGTVGEPVQPPTSFFLPARRFDHTGIRGLHQPRIVPILSRRYYEPIPRPSEWSPTAFAPSEGFVKENFQPFIFSRPPGWYGNDIDIDSNEEEITISDFLRTRETVSLDSVKLARKGFDAQAYKDLEYKNQILRRVANPYSRTKLRGIAPTTFRQYHSRVLTLIEGGYDPTLPGLGRFLADRANADDARFFAHNSLSTWRSAVVHFGVGLGYYFPTTNDILEYRKLKSGLKGMNAEGVTRVKGAITRKGIQEMLTWAQREVPENDRKWFMDGIIVQHAFGLRTSEVPCVSTRNCRLAPGSNEYLHTCPKNKDAVAYNRDEMKIEQHFSDVQWKAELDRISSGANEEVSRWVPNWCTWKANDYVKLCSEQLGWSPLLFWSNHGIRHGAAVDAARDAVIPADASYAQQVEIQDLAVFRRTAQLTEGMRRFYSEEPRHRVDRALHLKLISTTPGEIDDLVNRVKSIRDEAKKHLIIRNEEDVDDFDLSFEDEQALADCSAGEFVALLGKTMQRYKTIKNGNKSNKKNKKKKKDSSDEEESSDSEVESTPVRGKKKARTTASQRQVKKKPVPKVVAPKASPKKGPRKTGKPAAKVAKKRKQAATKKGKKEVLKKRELSQRKGRNK